MGPHGRSLHPTLFSDGLETSSALIDEVIDDADDADEWCTQYIVLWCAADQARDHERVAESNLDTTWRSLGSLTPCRMRFRARRMNPIDHSIGH